MKKRKCQAWVTAGLGLVVTFSLTGISVSGQTGPTKPATSEAKMTEEAYKNVQVLKGIPADRLIPAMQFITSSLGVECSFCHVEGAFEKDDKKPKQVARKMMKMMFAINQENFEGKREVTCYSCHRGSSHPLATPIIAETGTQAVPENVQDEDEHGLVPPGCLPGSKKEPLTSAGGCFTSTFSAKSLASEYRSSICPMATTSPHTMEPPAGLQPRTGPCVTFLLLR